LSWISRAPSDTCLSNEPPFASRSKSHPTYNDGAMVLSRRGKARYDPWPSPVSVCRRSFFCSPRRWGVQYRAPTRLPGDSSAKKQPPASAFISEFGGLAASAVGATGFEPATTCTPTRNGPLSLQLLSGCQPRSCRRAPVATVLPFGGDRSGYSGTALREVVGSDRPRTKLRAAPERDGFAHR